MLSQGVDVDHKMLSFVASPNVDIITECRCYFQNGGGTCSLKVDHIAISIVSPSVDLIVEWRHHLFY